MLRYLDAGESHGPALTAIVDGFPAGVKLSQDRMNELLACRQQGYGRGNRQKIEKDRVEIQSGVRHGVTLGSPITLRIPNRDWANWESAMNPWDVLADDAGGRAKKIDRPRPGHADLVGVLKYKFDDVRNALERASARHTAIRSAIGALCYEFLLPLGVRGAGFVTAVGSEFASPENIDFGSIAKLEKAIATSQLRCPDAAAERKMIELITLCKTQGDSLGGVIEVWFEGLVSGLGTYSQWDRRLDGRLAQALMSIQAFKGVEIGAGFRYAASRGSQSHDEIVIKEGHIARAGNNSGGLEAGMTNGERLVVRAGMKPLPTLVKALASVNLKSKKVEKATVERTDVCAIAAASIVGFSVTAIALAEVYLEKFGNDQMDDIVDSLNRYRDRTDKVLRC
ncbi:MAG: chorismate synthase [Deltaproteobacteria bacterium]|nr:chorismate synthase [Deltaproteobacteria bacterium]